MVRINDDERFGLGVLAGPALFVLSIGPTVSWGLGGPLFVLGLAGLAAVAAPALYARTSAGSSRYRVVYWSGGGDRADAARHEGGHLRAMDQVGYRDLRARIFPDGSGWARGIPPLDESPQDSIAVSYAGGYAEAGRACLDRPQCRSDVAHAHATRRAVPWSSRARVDRDAHRLAARYVRSGLARYSRPLERTGRYR